MMGVQSYTPLAIFRRNHTTTFPSLVAGCHSFPITDAQPLPSRSPLSMHDDRDANRVQLCETHNEEFKAMQKRASPPSSTPFNDDRTKSLLRRKRRSLGAKPTQLMAAVVSAATNFQNKINPPPQNSEPKFCLSFAREDYVPYEAPPLPSPVVLCDFVPGGFCGERSETFTPPFVAGACGLVSGDRSQSHDSDASFQPVGDFLVMEALRTLEKGGALKKTTSVSPKMHPARYSADTSSTYLLPTPSPDKRIRSINNRFLNNCSLSMKLPPEINGLLSSQRSEKKCTLTLRSDNPFAPLADLAEDLPTNFSSLSRSTPPVGKSHPSPSAFKPPHKTFSSSNPPPRPTTPSLSLPCAVPCSEAGKTPPPSPPLSPPLGSRLPSASPRSGSVLSRSPPHGLLGGVPTGNPNDQVYKVLSTIYKTPSPEIYISHENLGTLRMCSKPEPPSAKAVLPEYLNHYPPCAARLGTEGRAPRLRIDVIGVPMEKGVYIRTLTAALEGVGIILHPGVEFSSRTEHFTLKENNLTATHNIVTITVTNNDNLWQVINGGEAVFINGQRLGIQLNHTSNASTEFSCQVNRGPLASRSFSMEPMSVIFTALFALGWSEAAIVLYITQTIRSRTGLNIINCTFTTTTRDTPYRKPAAIAFWDPRAQLYLHFATPYDRDSYIQSCAETPLFLEFTQPGAPTLRVPLTPAPLSRSRPAPPPRNFVPPESCVGTLVRRNPEVTALMNECGRVMSAVKAYDTKLNNLTVEVKAMKDYTSHTNTSFSTKLTSLESNLESLTGSLTASTRGYEGLNTKIESLKGKIEQLLQVISKVSSPLAPTQSSHAA
jgi:hypothetical protein